MTRKCRRCGEVKLFNKFTKDKKCKNGILWICKECDNKKDRKNRSLKNEEKNKEIHRLEAQKLKKSDKWDGE